MIDGGILDGKMTFCTVNFTESKKQPHTDTAGNEWDLSAACCLAAAGSSGAAGRAQCGRRERCGGRRGDGDGVFSEHVNDVSTRLQPGLVQLSRL